MTQESPPPAFELLEHCAELARGPLTPSGFAAAFEVAAQRVLEPHAPNTRRAYRTAWGQWVAYCERHGFPSSPIDPLALVTYLEGRSSSDALFPLSPASVRQHLAALCTLDMAARLAAGEVMPSSVRESSTVRRWLQSWSREHPKAPKRQARAATRSELDRLLRAAQERKAGASRAAHIPRAARDRALILLGVLGALRGDEIAGLDVGDVQFVDRGLRLHVRRSKTDQHGEGRFVALLPQAAPLRCPIDAWRAWLSIRGEWAGPAFVAVSGSGELSADALTVDSVRRVISERAKAAGLKLSSHSLRSTFATLAAERRKPLASIMEHGRWKDANQALRYVRQLELFDESTNASAGLLDE
jgi:integrase